MRDSSAFSLRPHQRDAHTAVLQRFAGGADRALVVMPCGTGKSLVAMEVAGSVAGELGIAVVFVPTLALVRQTVTTWREHFTGTLGDVIVVGSEHGLVQAELSQFAASTDADIIALRLANRDTSKLTLVVATYHSSASLALAQSRCYAPLVFDIAVFDEAHHLATRHAGKFQAAITHVLAIKRVFFTATPTVTGSADPGWIPSRSQVSMDDETVFGPLAYRLTMDQARERGLLSDWTVLVRTSASSLDRLENAAAVILAAANEHHFKRILVYVNRVRDAHALCQLLSTTSLEDGTPIEASVVEATTTPGDRAAILGRLSDETTNLQVVANVNCLAEGVDIPRLDAVAFCADKTSRITITQILGRVLRTHPGKEIGFVILPVVADDTGTALTMGGFQTVWATCRALRDTDDAFAGALNQAARLTSANDRVTPALQRFDVQLDAVSTHDVVLAAVRASADPWWQHFGELEALVISHGTFDPSIIDDATLRTWCATQRRLRARGLLTEERAEALSLLSGWYWITGFSTAAESIKALCRAWPSSGLEQAHSISVPGWTKQAGVLAGWARVARRRGQLDADLVELLGSLAGWKWELHEPSLTAELDALARFRIWEGHADVPPQHTEHGIALGAAVARWRQANAAGTLHPHLRDEIVAAGLNRFRWKINEVRWEAFIEALAVWSTEHGSCHLPVDVVVPSAVGEMNLSRWVTRVRFLHRRNSVANEHVTALEAIEGWEWAAHAPRDTRDIGAASHGTRTGYVKGCRCQPCTDSNNSYRAIKGEQLRHTGVGTDLVDAARARSDLRRLAEAGLSLRTISLLLNVSRSTLMKLNAANRLRVLPRTAEVLALAEPAQLFQEVVRRAGEGDAYMQSVKVPSQEALNTLAGLVERGWPKSWLAREAGLGASVQVRAPLITALNAHRITELAGRCAHLTPPKRQARRALPPLDELLKASATQAA